MASKTEIRRRKETDIKVLTTSFKLKPKAKTNPVVEKNRRRQVNAQIADKLGLVTKLDTGKSRLYVGNISGLSLSEDLVKTIQKLELPRHHTIKVYDREVHPPRECQFFSDEAKHYSFSGSKAEAKPLTSELFVLLNNVNTKFQDRYNGILVNRYLNEKDNIGQHSDDEKELGDSGVVAIVLGATRVFRIHRKYRDDQGKLKTKKELDVELPHGSLVWMEGDFQKEFKHSVPSFKATKEARISFTFRVHH